MLMTIITFIVVGLIAGAVARFLIPGKDKIGIIGTIILGIVGSFLGGFLWNLFKYQKTTLTSLTGFHPIDIIGSIIGAIILLLILRFTGLERKFS